MKEISEILMKCIECLAEKEEKDFLGKEICYKCQYKKRSDDPRVEEKENVGLVRGSC